MKIAYLCGDPGVPIGGSKGAAVHVAEMARAFASLGHEVRVVARRSDRGAAAEPPYRVAVPPADPIARAVDGWLKADPDASPADAWTVSAIAGGAAFRQFAVEEVRAFRPDLLYERYALFGGAGAMLAQTLGIPLVLEVNAPLTDEQLRHRGLSFASTARAAEREILRRADAVVTVSEALRAWLEQHDVPSHRIMVLPNGVDPDRFGRPPDPACRSAARRRLGLDGQPVAGFVGTLKAWHDVASLVQAVGGVRRRGIDARLLVVGDGPQREPLGAVARAAGVDGSVIFTGSVPHDDVPALLAAMDVGVAPYAEQSDFYFSPLKLFEYLAAGLPVVAARIGDLDHCVGQPGAGWTYRPGDVDGLGAALSAALGDPVEAARRGEAGRAHVLAAHTWRHNAEAVLTMARRT